MDASELLDELSVRIYEPPLSLLREDGRISDVSQPISVAMLLIDYDTECSMNGILNFLGNSTGAYSRQTVLALRRIGCGDHADTLHEICRIATDAGMTHSAIQEDRASLTEFSVTSFDDTHGSKWDDVTARIQALHDDVDFADLYDRLTSFVGANRHSIEPMLAHSGG
tara:strand:+ start:1148 stop:1651 length:504 start_codon:yes stop_codon:yes gene_type:complete